DDTGVFTIKYRVEAFDGTVYVADSATATTASTVTGTSISAVLYLLDEAGTATTADASALVTYTTGNGASDSSNSNIALSDGESTEVTLTINRTNSGDSVDDGLYRALLKAIGWNTGDSASVFNIYNFDLEDFKTDPVSLN
ncbi:MAG: hypothetical protein KBC48_03040, partial [Candidatus Pacebacteria bacterium]|nr:hypothetical protein [Candidatus Paceibacterota bacterium]